jgi:hypothetical protein
VISSPLSTLKFRLIFSGAWLVWSMLQVAVLNGLGVPLRMAIVDSAVTNSLLAASCVLISNNLKFYLPGKEKQWYIIVIGLVLAAIWLFLSHWLLKYFMNDDAAYNHFLVKSLPLRFGIAFLVITSMAVVCMLWYSLEDQRENEKRKSDAERLSRDAELFKLRQQLQPHFLFNSLNSVNALIGTRPEEARHMIQQLSDFLRGTLKKEENQWMTYEEEMNHLQLYLEIEKVRFGHRLSTMIDTDEEAKKMKLPALLLQPVVENAIKFGLYDTTETITIKIIARAQPKELVVTCGKSVRS